MTRDDDDNVIRILATPAAAARINRRQLLGAAGAGFALVACGTDDDDATPPRSTASTPAASAPPSPSETASASASASPSETAAESPSESPTAAAEPAKLEKNLNMYTWAEYQDEDNVKNFTKTLGPKVKIDEYDSNEAMIAKLELAKGSAGYDLVVPTGVFIPQMVQKGLLRKLDKSKIPNFANLEEAFLDQPWDPGNEYSVVKDWGSTGYLWDSKGLKDDIKTWADFFEAAKKVSGKVSVLAAPGDVTGMYFWREGIPWTTEEKADLDAAEKALLAELAPHVRAFDSYPSEKMLEGAYVLSQAWNGDARIAVQEDPERYRWALGAPKTELWVDNFAILASAKNPEAAHAFINYMLDVDVSAKEVEYHGFNTAVKGVREKLGKDLDQAEIIYFTAEEIQRLEAGAVNSAQDRIVAIYNKVKAAAGK
jgi:spermidine/putrescine transport system substrate-binding protein